jgi:predicted nucleic acid-binding Zn ribbon protein
MPVFVLKCVSCEYTEDVLCKYSNIVDHKCSKCGNETKQVPTGAPLFHIEGFSAENGYHRPEFSSVTGQDASWD